MKIDKFTDQFRFLSNFWYCDIRYEGIIYPSVEHAFQASKTLVQRERMNIALLKTAGQAKRAGKKLRLRPDWEFVKLDIMQKLVTTKFKVHENLRHRLITTHDAELIESNTWNDTFWGMCNGVGENHLGKILMKVRNKYTKR